MGYTFTNKPFEWTKQGQDPTQAEIDLGLQGGMALPAEFVNQQWTKTYNAIEEVQDWIEGFKLPPGLILSAYSTELLTSMSVQVTSAWEGGGTLSAESSDTDIAAVSVSGSTITITGGDSSGAAIITVRVSETEHYQETAATIFVTNVAISPTLANNTPAQIRDAAKTGLAANIWSVGDKVGIQMSGTIGSLTLNDTYYAFIIGFNHNSAIEGNNTIHFQFGKAADGTKTIAFVDSQYGSYTSNNYFTMNTSSTNAGGWASSRMRTTLMPQFKAAMPSEWRDVISPCTKYSDNTGGGSDTASYVTATTDDIFLLAEYEVQGARTYANSNEKNYQQQYDYYANGNSKIFYKYNNENAACGWWLRSVYAAGTYSFCSVTADGSASRYVAYYSYGLASGFKVA